MSNSRGGGVGSWGHPAGEEWTREGACRVVGFRARGIDAGAWGGGGGWRFLAGSIRSSSFE